MLTALWLKFKSYIIGAGVVLLALLSIFLKGRSDGVQAEKAKQEKANVAAIKRKAGVKPNDSKSVAGKLRTGKY